MPLHWIRIRKGSGKNIREGDGMKIMSMKLQPWSCKTTISPALQNNWGKASQPSRKGFSSQVSAVFYSLISLAQFSGQLYVNIGGMIPKLVDTQFHFYSRLFFLAEAFFLAGSAAFFRSSGERSRAARSRTV